MFAICWKSFNIKIFCFGNSFPPSRIMSMILHTHDEKAWGIFFMHIKLSKVKVTERSLMCWKACYHVLGKTATPNFTKLVWYHRYSKFTRWLSFGAISSKGQGHANIYNFHENSQTALPCFWENYLSELHETCKISSNRQASTLIKFWHELVTRSRSCRCLQFVENHLTLKCFVLGIASLPLGLWVWYFIYTWYIGLGNSFHAWCLTVKGQGHWEVTHVLESLLLLCRENRYSHFHVTCGISSIQ